MLKNITYISAGKSSQEKKITKRKQGLSEHGKLMLLFLTGVILGTMIVNLFCKGEYDKFGIYSEYFIERFQAFEVENKALFLYSFSGRMKEVCFLLLLSFTSLGIVAQKLYLLYKGMTIGILVSIYVLQYGTGGILLYMISIFPHYITYVLMILLMILFCEDITETLKRYQSEGLRKTKDVVYMIVKTKLMTYLRCLLVLFVLNIITSYLETFINLNFMRSVLK